MTNISVISTAHIHARQFLRNLADGTDGRRIHAIWDEIPERGRRYAEEFKARFEPELATALHDPAVHGFTVTAENTRHLPVLEQVIPIGKPVFCEKPLSTTVSDARRIAALVASHGTRLISGYQFPFRGDLQAAARMLANGEFGRVTRVTFRCAHHAAYGRWFDSPDLQWFWQPELSGGGGFIDLGTHAVHALRSLFGRVDQVWATISNESAQYPTCDDFGIAHLRFANGILGTVEAGWTQTGGIEGLEIVGSRKSLWHDGRTYVSGGPGLKTVPVIAAADRPWAMNRLVDLVRGGVSDAEVSADLAACLDAVAIMQGAYES
ncbi:MAG: Gfo/Idh/MocA family oxidoreductase, partial [Planctomycetes bacterium]|nr:Gfo/Idh/MocA family oxidoreductase [Planctomycetota bacterium]